MNVRRGIAILVCAAIVAIFAWLALRPAPEPPEVRKPILPPVVSPTVTATSELLSGPPEILLATEDVGHPVDKDGPEVARAKRALDKAESRFDNSRADIANKALLAHQYTFWKRPLVPSVQLLEQACEEVSGTGPKSKKLDAILEGLTTPGHWRRRSHGRRHGH